MLPCRPDKWPTQVPTGVVVTAHDSRSAGCLREGQNDASSPPEAKYPGLVDGRYSE